MSFTLPVKLLNDAAKPPTRGSAGAAGYDLYACENGTLPPRGKAKIRTGIAIKIPEDYYGRIAPRSGLAANYSIDIGGGVIDSDYRGEISVIMFNHEERAFQIKAGDRIAQLIIEKIATPVIEVVSELDDTARGNAGFGSTGIN